MRQYAPGVGAGIFLERAVRRKATGARLICVHQIRHGVACCKHAVGCALQAQVWMVLWPPLWVVVFCSVVPPASSGRNQALTAAHSAILGQLARLHAASPLLSYDL